MLESVSAIQADAGAENRHASAHGAAFAVERARAQVAALVGASARDIVWTSGATESNNLALKGAAHANRA